MSSRPSSPEAARSDPLSEPPLSCFLRVLRRELDTTVAPDIGSERARGVIDLMRHVLEHLIAREESLTPALAEVVAAQEQALRSLCALLGEEELPAPTGPAQDGVEAAYAQVSGKLESSIAELMPRLSALAPAQREQARAALRTVVRSERKLHDDLEQAEAAVKRAAAETAAAESAGLDPQRLQRYLEQKTAGQGSVEVLAVDTPLGGYSKDTFIVRLAGAGRPADEIVVRRDMSRGPLEGSVVDEFEVIRAMHEAGVPVAQPLWAEPDPVALGSPFLVVRRVRGVQVMDMKLGVAGDGGEGVRQLARVLAEVHRVDTRKVSGRASPAERSTREHILALLDQFEGQWRRRRLGPSAVIAAGLAWMRHHVPDELPAPCIVHGDATMRNLLFDQGRVSAMLDWETWHLGDPAEDLVYARAEAERFLPWSDFVGEYVCAGGVPLSAQRERYWGMWMVLRGAITSVSMMDRLLVAPTPDIRPAFGGPHFTRYCVRQVADFLAST